jgi:MFS family permease
MISGVAAVLMIPTSLLIRRAPILTTDQSASASAPVETASSNMSLSQAIRSPQFVILCLTNFFCCATHSGPIFHTVSYAEACGIPMITAVTIYSVEGLAGMGGRIVFGILGDRLGAKRVLVSGLLLQAFGASAYYFVHELSGFYAAAATFGFIYAGVMPLYAVIARENFPLRMMGTVIGGTAMAGSLGMATGPVVGGLIFDRLGSYGWLYLGSAGIGLGAFLVAMMFKPIPRNERELAAVPVPQ